jgi:glutathione peroxidase-family protein
MTSTKNKVSKFLVSHAIRCVFPNQKKISILNLFKSGGQEPGDDQGIAEFCTLNHGVTFPLMKKSDVNGDSTNEVYRWLKSEKPGIMGLTRIKVCLNAPLLDSWFED